MIQMAEKLVKVQMFVFESRQQIKQNLEVQLGKAVNKKIKNDIRADVKFKPTKEHPKKRIKSKHLQREARYLGKHGPCSAAATAGCG